MNEESVMFRDEVQLTDLEKTKRFFDDIGISYVTFTSDEYTNLYMTGDYHDVVKNLPEEEFDCMDLNFWEFENGKLVSY